jgi:predicted RNA-binding Zn-ribbon protein involved in translation (DUF1610 family)
MSISDELLQLAKETALNAQLHLAALDKEEAAIEARKVEIAAEREKIGVAAKRALDFRAQVGADFQCPRCWVDYERRARLIPAEEDTKAGNSFRCRTCGFEHVFTST